MNGLVQDFNIIKPLESLFEVKTALSIYGSVINECQKRKNLECDCVTLFRCKVTEVTENRAGE
jgi:hypothetical protein